ncbi:MAG: FHA domain-containing protein [Candidatus Eisenbacteria bacterium]|uniref:FHA domain-containing protein n=1 Tax=Eiseniibacteriota bacterium TaxID=2212470 RepID=A0A948RU56_UNCEI|nr:FHA domain-containing protein [Candidatus Eisenbacteria bacterium]MBU1948540.1 FHA domain-containing protein [Candidatus Eisenbacteria bacterium]MBU2691070.1 FHA domain-containing protein [Candidatus Eisenbacteria bacterium]
MSDDMGKTKKMCPNGHLMDPAWEVCPYCPSDRTGSPDLAKTVRVEDVKKTPPPPPPRPEVRKTEILRTKPAINGVGWFVSIKGASQGTIHTVQSEKATLGAAAGCDIRLTDSHASDQHASLRFADGCFTLTDLDSTNGTMINGKKIARQKLADGDQVSFGSSEWIFKFVQWES